MAGKKRARRANGEWRKDASGKTKQVRRKNLTGTLEKRGDQWLARYYVYIDGQRKRKTKYLGAVSIDEARARLQELSDGGAAFTQERELEKVQVALSGVRADIADAQKQAAAQAEQERMEADERRAVAIADGWTIYAASKKRPDSGARTLAGYEAQYKTFAEWCATNHPDKPKMRDFTPEMAEAFIDHIEQTRSRSTRNKYLVFLRCFWRVLRWNADAQLTLDPWEGIRTLTATPDTVSRRDLTVEELGRIAAYLRTDEAKASLAYTYKPDDQRKNPEAWDLRGEMLSLVALGVYLGARLGDCVTLQWSAVDLALGTITFMPRKTARKYKREVTAPIHPALARLLASVPAGKRRGYLLPMLAEIYTNREPSLITNRFQSVLRAAGIETAADAPDGEGGGTRARVAVGFHSLRHFFAAWLDNHGVNHSLTNYLTCHQQGTVEATYYHHNREALAAAVATLPTIPTLTGDTDTAQDALTDATSTKPTITPEVDADAIEGRFSAFRAIVEKMSAGELKRAAKMIAHYQREK